MNVAIPVIRRSARVQRSDHAVVLRYLADEITLEGRAAALFSKMLPHLDGKTHLEEMAAQIQEPPGHLRTLADRLCAVGVLTFTAADSESQTMTGEQFYHLHRKYCAHWLRPVYEHPLWEKMVTGKATRAQVIGFAFEKYHYIEGAYEHMAIAAANATPEMMPHLARHFIEEYTHGDIYRNGLRSLFRDELIVAAQPLPSTRALVNFLSESAATSSFSYYAGNELLQLTENTSDAGARGSIAAFYQALRRNYPYTAKLIDSFIAHTRADQKLGHEDVFHKMCRSVPPLSRREVCDAVNVARSTAEHLVLFLDGIDRHYERFPTVPRLPGDLLSQ